MGPERDRGAGWTIDWAGLPPGALYAGTGKHGYQRHPRLPRCPLARFGWIILGSSRLAARMTYKEMAAYAAGVAAPLPDHGRRTS